MNSEKKPIRILHILRGGRLCDGTVNFVLNYYRHIDRNRVQFDFLFNSLEKGYYDDEIQSLGGKTFYFGGREDMRLLRYIRELSCFFQAHPEYKIIHGHMPGFAPIYFAVAKKCGIPVRISHSHFTRTEPTIKGWFLDKMVRLIKYPSNVHWACSSAAGKYMYGTGQSFTIIPNAISAKRFFPNRAVRSELREQLGLSNKFVVGNVGRLCPQKNQKFLLQVFAKVKELRSDAVLFLIGEGELEQELRTEAEKLGLKGCVLLIGAKMEIENYYQAMDVFVLPSTSEGLGIVLLEAQACGIASVASTEVPEEADMTGKVAFLPLRGSIESWAEEIIAAPARQAGAAAALQKNGYDIECAAERLAERYERLFIEAGPSK